MVIKSNNYSFLIPFTSLNQYFGAFHLSDCLFFVYSGAFLGRKKLDKRRYVSYNHPGDSLQGGVCYAMRLC